MEPLFILSDLDLDEISTVNAGDNPTAEILIAKSSPGGGDMHAPKALDVMDFKHAGRLGKKKGPKSPFSDEDDEDEKVEKCDRPRLQH